MEESVLNVKETIARDLPEALASLNEFKDQAASTTAAVLNLLQKARDGRIQTAKGISFLEVKCHMLLSYLINLSYVVLKKVSGGQLEGDASIDRLVEIRTVLERMRPVDYRLKYQIDKLVKTAATKNIDPSDPLHFKANPDNLVSKLSDIEGSEQDSNEDSAEEKQPKVYVPPKLSAVYYDADESVNEKKQRLLERARKRALSSSIIQDLRREYDEGPEEIKDTTDFHKLKEDRAAKARMKYEEDNFIRLTLSKKQKHTARQLATMSSLGSLAKFEDISALDSQGLEDIPVTKKKAKQLSPKKGKKKKGFRKRRK